MTSQKLPVPSSLRNLAGLPQAAGSNRPHASDSASAKDCAGSADGRKRRERNRMLPGYRGVAQPLFAAALKTDVQDQVNLFRVCPSQPDHCLHRCMENLRLAEIRVLLRLSARQLHGIDRRLFIGSDRKSNLVAIQVVTVCRGQTRNQRLCIRRTNFDGKSLFNGKKFFLIRSRCGPALKSRKEP